MGDGSRGDSMRLRFFGALILLLSVQTQPQAQSACDATVSSASALTSAIGATPTGTRRTICLTSGSYGDVTFSGTAITGLSSRTAMITIRSATGTGASIAPYVTAGARFLRFRNVVFSGGVALDGCSRNIEFVNSAFVGNTDGMILNNYNQGCGTSSQNILIDGVNFTNTGAANLSEGRLGLRGVIGVTVRNSTFAGNQTGNGGDGVQLTAGSSQNVIGPGNVFSGIKQSSCTGPSEPHCDPIQQFGASNNTITGNYFVGNSTGLMMNDGDGPLTVTHNVFVTDGEYPDQIVRACGSGTDVIEHNTFANGARVRFGDSLGTCNSVTLRNNIITGGLSMQAGNTCTGITSTYNLSASTLTCNTSNNLTGSPTYTGGSSPSTWQGYRLTAGSTGKGNGSDSKDRGSNYFNPAAPTNFGQ
jgi:hypothetical protein